MINIVSKKNLVLLSLITCSTSYAASFDCEKVSSSVEKLICSDYTLNRLDDFLSWNFKMAMNSEMPDTVKTEIKRTQLDWLEKRNECTDAQCIKMMYSKRIDSIWDKCFDHIPGKIVCVKFSDASDTIEKEKYAKSHKSSADVISQFTIKHASQVSELGFTEEQLKSTIFIDVGSYARYSTLEEYLSLLFELPGFKSLGKINYKNNIGIQLKLSGKPYSGFIFRKEGDELYLSGLVSGDEVLEAVTIPESRTLTGVFMSYGSYVINKNSAK